MTRRIVVSYLILTLLLLAALEIPLALTLEDRAREDLTTDVLRDAFNLAALAEDTLEGTSSIDLQGLADNYQERTGARVVIVDSSGIQVADSAGSADNPRDFSTRDEFIGALGGNVASGTRHSDTLGGSMVYVAVPVASSGVVHGAVRVTYPTSEVDARVREAWLALLAIAGLSLVMAAVVGVVLARSATQPLAEVTEAASALGAGDLGARAPDRSGPPEVRLLAGSFNDMATRLEALLSAQQAFVADASHQLRTPLTALRLRLENLEAEAATAQDAAELRAAMDEADRLSRLVDGLLVLARAERTGAGATAVPVDVRMLLTDRAAVWTPVAEERGLSIVVDDVGARCTLLATPDHLEQALDNLIANALDAAPSGTVLRLGAGIEGEWCALHVTDAGPGLDAAQRERAFDRFWRASSTRTDLSGSGLGLAIVRSLAEADGGTAELRANGDGPGLDAVLLLPNHGAPISGADAVVR